jgi:hypothetical protein
VDVARTRAGRHREEIGAALPREALRAAPRHTEHEAAVPDQQELAALERERGPRARRALDHLAHPERRGRDRLDHRFVASRVDAEQPQLLGARHAIHAREEGAELELGVGGGRERRAVRREAEDPTLVDQRDDLLTHVEAAGDETLLSERPAPPPGCRGLSELQEEHFGRRGRDDPPAAAGERRDPQPRRALDVLNVDRWPPWPLERSAQEGACRLPPGRELRARQRREGDRLLDRPHLRPIEPVGRQTSGVEEPRRRVLARRRRRGRETGGHEPGEPSSVDARGALAEERHGVEHDDLARARQEHVRGPQVAVLKPARRERSDDLGHRVEHPQRLAQRTELELRERASRQERRHPEDRRSATRFGEDAEVDRAPEARDSERGEEGRVLEQPLDDLVRRASEAPQLLGPKHLHDDRLTRRPGCAEGRCDGGRAERRLHDVPAAELARDDVAGREGDGRIERGGAGHSRVLPSKLGPDT